ncbi:cytochrome P450 704C1 isoform X1 [Spinacia oleracea]|uniref:Cytochrome P450 704C1 isoform X1 n=1 Tax=Spinacia oleracea TaxID=3562 RepID=A0ABM3RD28_SPIOL|nr:cytochrome P450 704C1-like isoform X1 [Spinacia oleracea]
MDFFWAAILFIASAVFLIFILILVVIVKIYSGKSIGNPNYPPVQGTVFHLLFNFNKLYDYLTEIARKHPTFRVLSPDQSDVYTTDVRNIQHILKTKFDTYTKGKYDRDILEDLSGEGIFAVDGDKWRQQRKIASFEFSARVLRDFSCAVFRISAAKLVRIISANYIFDIHDMLMRCTLDSIFKVGFGVDMNCLEGSSKEGIEFMKAFDDANALVYWRYVDPLWKLRRALNIGSEATLKKNIKVMDAFVNGVITTKRKQLAEQQDSIVKEDILSRFIEASKKEPDQMTDQYLRDIILNFMIAGKDSTANTVSWFIYMLCKNPLIQEKIFQEVKEYIIDTDDEINIDDFVDRISDEILDKMHYLHSALTETLRLYPGVPVDGRTTQEDDVLPDGYKVKKGETVNYLAYTMGRMPYIWGDDADEFRPERWLDQNGVFQQESPFKFIAFHAGPRICLGKDFAYRQMKIVSIALLRLFRFRLGDETRKVTYRTMFTLHVDGGLHVQALPRVAMC